MNLHMLFCAESLLAAIALFRTWDTGLAYATPPFFVYGLCICGFACDCTQMCFPPNKAAVQQRIDPLEQVSGHFY